MTPLLSASDLSAGYLGHPVIRDFSIDINPGEIVALIGSNGAGKTTALRALAGDLPTISGQVRWEGTPTDAPLHRRSKMGLSFVTEERSVFMGLSVADNIRLGRCNAADVFEIFPELKPMLKRRAGSLSGGEQQMLSLGRALARRPKALLADELSLGLAPLIVKRLLAAVRRATDEQDLGVLLVEQHVHQALQLADRWYVLRRGEIVLAGSAADANTRLAEIQAAYV